METFNWLDWWCKKIWMADELHKIEITTINSEAKWKRWNYSLIKASLVKRINKEIESRSNGWEI